MIFPDVSSFWVLLIRLKPPCFSMENPNGFTGQTKFLVASRCSPIVPYGNPQDGFMETKNLTVSWEKNREKRKNPNPWGFPLVSSRFHQVLADPPQHLFGRGGGGWDVAAAPGGTPGLGAQALHGELGSQQEIIIELPQLELS
jgi:hypothetical protein